MVARSSWWEEKEDYCRQNRRQHACGIFHYPPELQDLPPFPEWLRVHVQSLVGRGEHVEEDIVQYTQPLERYVIAHR